MLMGLASKRTKRKQKQRNLLASLGLLLPRASNCSRRDLSAVSSVEEHGYVTSVMVTAWVC